MALPELRRRLIVNADDFGRSTSINHAVLQAHQQGILTTASLMTNEAACDEAVALAKQAPALGTGLHLTFLHGHAALPPSRIPGLVTARGEFSYDPVWTGMRYFFQRSLRAQLRLEMEAQLERFAATGLPLDHVNGHLHMHLHPVVFDLLAELIPRWKIKAVRLTRDPLPLNLQLARGAYLYRVSHALIYRLLSARVRRKLERLNVKFTDRVFGLLQNARVDESYILGLLDRLPAGDSELYSHPSLDAFKHEYDALIGPAVLERVRQNRVQLIRYQDL